MIGIAAAKKRSPGSSFSLSVATKIHGLLGGPYFFSLKSSEIPNGAQFNILIVNLIPNGAMLEIEVVASIVETIQLSQWSSQVSHLQLPKKTLAAMGAFPTRSQPLLLLSCKQMGEWDSILCRL